jgi:hypothetical protein
MVDQVILAPESFRTIYLRKEDRVILRTEQGRKIIIKRIIPDEWQAYRIYEYERDRNEAKKEIFLFDNRFLPQLTREFKETIRAEET